MPCDDTNPCTDDDCAPATGCTHNDNTELHTPAGCEPDGFHPAVFCQGGQPVPQDVVPCDDTNPCTDDTCTDPAVGCEHPAVADGTSCDDGSPETVNDKCVAGTCSGSGVCGDVLAHWEFDGDGADASGNGLSATVQTGYSQDCVSGECLLFTGSSSETMPLPIGLPGDQVTLSTWINIDTFTHPGGNNFHAIAGTFSVHNGQFYFPCGQNGGAAFFHPITPGQWYHLVLTLDRTTDTARVYINGELIGEQINSAVDGLAGGMISGNGCTGNGNDFFRGRVDDYRVVAGELDAACVQALYEEHAASVCAGGALGCDDEDPCSDDACDASGYCTHSGACDTADPCPFGAAETDAAARADSDSDGVGDSCDPCPLDASDACASDLLAWWPLEDAQDPGADVSGNGHHLTATGDVVGGEDGAHGQAARFTSHEHEQEPAVESGRLCVSDDGWTAPMESAFSVEAWVRPTAYVELASGDLQGHAPVGRANGFVMRYGSSWAPLSGKHSSVATQAGEPYLGCSDEGSQLCVLGQLDLEFDGWHHLAFTWDGTTLRAFVDGVLDPETTQPPLGLDFADGHQVCVGGQESQEFVTGWIDEVKLWSKAIDYSKDSDGDGLADVVDPEPSVPAVGCLPPAQWASRTAPSAPRATRAAAAVGDSIWLIGGNGASEKLKSTLRYHVPSDTWFSGPDLPEVRDSAATAPWGDGLFVFGGIPGGVPSETAYPGFVLFLDTTTETFEERASMPTKVGEMPAVVLDGKIHLIGGSVTSGSKLTDKHQIYDPALDQWTDGPDLPGEITTASAAVIDGRIWVGTGLTSLDSAGDLANLWTYDPDDGWAVGPAIPEVTRHVPVVAVGHVLAVIGSGDNGVASEELRLYDTRAAQWLHGPALDVAISSGSAVISGDSLHLFAGYDSGTLVGAHRALPTSAIADPPGWSFAAPLPQKRDGHSVARAGERLLVMGGKADGAQTSTVLSYDPALDVWASVGALPEPARGASAATLGGTAHFVGGGKNGAGYLDTHVEWDPSSAAFVPRAPITTPVNAMGAVGLGDLLYVLGGDKGGCTNCFQSFVHVWDPTTDTWSMGPNMPGSIFLVETVVLDDTIYVVGGTHPSGADLTSVYRLAPPHTGWESTDVVQEPHRGAGAVVVGDRIAVIGGGPNGNAKSSVRLYDPGTGGWTSGPPLHMARSATGATAVVGDRVYVVGGHDGSVSLDSVEIASLAELSCPLEPVDVQTLTLNAATNCLDVSPVAQSAPVTAGQAYELSVTGAVNWGAGEVGRTALVVYEQSGRTRLTAIPPGPPTTIHPTGEAVRLFVLDAGKCSDNSGTLSVAGLGSPIPLSAKDHCVSESGVSKSPTGLVAGASYTARVAGESSLGVDALLRHARTVDGVFATWLDSVAAGHARSFTAASAGFYALLIDDGACADNDGTITVTFERY